MIEQRIRKILSEIPPGVDVVGAAKNRSSEEVACAVRGGLKIIGHNYLHEAEKMFPAIGNKVKWHFIGSVQGNKIRKMLDIFDMIETLDSLRHCEMIEKFCSRDDRKMPALVEINIAGEAPKSGITAGEAHRFVEEVSQFPHIRVEGLMTMGPLRTEDASREYFRMMKKIFEEIKGMNLPNVAMKYLSMGMSETYMTAIREGANLVRIGTKLFGERR